MSGSWQASMRSLRTRRRWGSKTGAVTQGSLASSVVATDTSERGDRGICAQPSEAAGATINNVGAPPQLVRYSSLVLQNPTAS